MIARKESDSPAKRYLGDAVYAEIEDGMVKLTTEDGIQATNTIYLEPEVFNALCAYVDDIRRGRL